MTGDPATIGTPDVVNRIGNGRLIVANPSLVRNTTSLLLFRGVAIALQAAGAVIAARYLGPEGRGLMATAIAGPAVAVNLLILGLGIANVYFLAREEVAVERALGTSLAAAFGVGCLAAAAYIGFALLFRRSVLNGLPTDYVLVGALLIPTVLAVRYVSSVAQGLQRISLLNSVGVVAAGVTVALYLLFLVLMGAGPLAALVIAVVASLVGLTPILVILALEYGRFRFDRGYLWRGMRFGAKGEAGNFIAFLGYRVDLLIVAGMLGFSAAGQYVVAFTAVELLWVVPNALAVVLFPRVAASELNATKRGSEATAQIARLTILLLVVFALAGAILAPFAIPHVFSAAFRSSVVPLELLIPGVVLSGVGKVLSADLAGRGHVGLPGLANGIGLAVMVGLDFLLIPIVGLRGAALASSVAYLVIFVILGLMFKRITGATFVSILLARRSDIQRAREAVRTLFRRTTVGQSIGGPYT